VDPQGRTSPGLRSAKVDVDGQRVEANCLALSRQLCSRARYATVQEGRHEQRPLRLLRGQPYWADLIGQEGPAENASLSSVVISPRDASAKPTLDDPRFAAPLRAGSLRRGTCGSRHEPHPRTIDPPGPRLVALS